MLDHRDRKHEIEILRGHLAGEFPHKRPYDLDTLAAGDLDRAAAETLEPVDVPALVVCGEFLQDPGISSAHLADPVPSLVTQARKDPCILDPLERVVRPVRDPGFQPAEVFNFMDDVEHDATAWHENVEPLRKKDKG